MYQGHLHRFMIVSVVRTISALACNVTVKRGTNPTQPPVNHQLSQVFDHPLTKAQIHPTFHSTNSNNALILFNNRGYPI
jgi:hypothetical protein